MSSGKSADRACLTVTPYSIWMVTAAVPWARSPRSTTIYHSIEFRPNRAPSRLVRTPTCAAARHVRPKMLFDAAILECDTAGKETAPICPSRSQSSAPARWPARVICPTWRSSKMSRSPTSHAPAAKAEGVRPGFWRHRRQLHPRAACGRTRCGPGSNGRDGAAGGNPGTPCGPPQAALFREAARRTARPGQCRRGGFLRRQGSAPARPRRGHRDGHGLQLSLSSSRPSASGRSSATATSASCGRRRSS